jgi:lysophospholipase L1-like esterase
MLIRSRVLLASGIAVALVVAVGIGIAVAPHPTTDVAQTDGDTIAASATPAPKPSATVKPKVLPKDIGDYVALGDSYAAGVGAGEEQGNCLRSPFSYPSLLNGTIGIDLTSNMACTGATTTVVQTRQLRALHDTTKLVTLSVGGNDLNVASLAGLCTAQTGPACTAALKQSLSLLKTLPDRLSDTYRAVAKAAPNAKIVVTGYPSLYSAGAPTFSNLSTETIINAATSGLDSAIKTAVDKEKKAGLNVEFVPVDFNGHGIGSRTSWIVPTGPDAYHATATGYKAYAKAIVGVL